MENIENMLNINYQDLFITIFIILFAVVSIVKIIEEISKIIGKPVKWIKKKEADHNLLLKTTNDLNELKKRHYDDFNNLSDFFNEFKEFVEKTQSQIEHIGQNRIHDREQSFKIQKELTNNIKAIFDNGIKRDEQINNLINGTKELLGDKIDQKFSRYISLGGIPENEVDELDSMYSAYEKTGGNSTRKHKYEYIKHNMPVMPVKINLIDKE